MKYQVWIIHSGKRIGQKKKFVKEFNNIENAKKFIKSKGNKTYFDIFRKKSYRKEFEEETGIDSEFKGGCEECWQYLLWLENKMRLIEVSHE